MRKGRPRAAAMRQWMKRRGLADLDIKESVVLWNGYAIYVAGAGRLPQNKRLVALLDEVQAAWPKHRPALVRAVDTKAERCVLHVRMEDALPMMVALEDQEVRR